MNLREFKATHIDEQCQSLSGTHENELFFNCVFDRLNGLNLINCDLNKSKFKTSKIKDAMDFGLTLSCLSFKDVEYSPLLFDLLLYLMSITKGNDEKRRQIIRILGQQKHEAIGKILEVTE